MNFFYGVPRPSNRISDANRQYQTDKAIRNGWLVGFRLVILIAKRRHAG